MLASIRYFRLPLAVAFLLLVLAYLLGGVSGLFLAGLLSILEVTLSFDNAVVNARVLEHMNVVWRRRFLTWGILIAVVGTRFILPILIVSLVAVATPWHIMTLILTDPKEYALLLTKAHSSIKAFGGMFLIMVALKYFVDDTKTVHWMHMIERYLARLGSVEAAEVLIGLVTLLGLAFAVPLEARMTVLISGLVGLILFLIMRGITGALSLMENTAVSTGVALFLYLEVLDSAFSLDGVVGAFALTNDLITIALGLGIGAYLVRSITLYLVKQRTLKEMRYLEHGAHWAIFGLAVAMFVGLLVHVPEMLTGTIGVTFIVAAYVSSLRHTRTVTAR